MNVSVDSNLFDEYEAVNIYRIIDNVWKENQKKIDFSKSFFQSIEYEGWHIERILKEILENFDKYKKEGLVQAM